MPLVARLVRLDSDADDIHAHVVGEALLAEDPSEGLYGLARRVVLVGRRNGLERPGKTDAFLDTVRARNPVALADDVVAARLAVPPGDVATNPRTGQRGEVVPTESAALWWQGGRLHVQSGFGGTAAGSRGIRLRRWGQVLDETLTSVATEHGPRPDTLVLAQPRVRFVPSPDPAVPCSYVVYVTVTGHSRDAATHTWQVEREPRRARVPSENTADTTDTISLDETDRRALQDQRIRNVLRPALICEECRGGGRCGRATLGAAYCPTERRLRSFLAAHPGQTLWPPVALRVQVAAVRQTAPLVPRPEGHTGEDDTRWTRAHNSAASEIRNLLAAGAIETGIEHDMPRDTGALLDFLVTHGALTYADVADLVAGLLRTVWEQPGSSDHAPNSVGWLAASLRRAIPHRPAASCEIRPETPRQGRLRVTQRRVGQSREARPGMPE